MHARWIAVVALVAAACNKAEDAATSPSAALPSANPAKSEKRDAGASAVDPAIERKIASDLEVQKALLVQREEVMHNLQGRFDEVTQRIDAMREKVEKASSEVREETASMLTDVRTRQASLRNELEKLPAVAADRWKAETASFEKDLVALEKSTESLMMKVK